MKIDHCDFPDDLLYDGEGLVWARLAGFGDAVIGITSIYAAVAGPLAKVAAKPTGVSYAKGAAIALLEGGKYFGPVRTPLSGELRAVNQDVIAKPRRVTDDPYGEGWIVRLRPASLPEDRKGLLPATEARDLLTRQIASLRVRCFSAFPNHEMFEIGVECSAVLAKLNDLLARIPLGEVVHLVTDDPTAPIEMVRWSDESGQPVIDERKEGNLFHFLVRKVA